MLISGKSFRNKKTLLAHGPTIQRRLSELNHVNTRSNGDCIWEKSQTVEKSCSYDHVMNHAEILDLTSWNIHQVNSNTLYPPSSVFWLKTGMFTTTEHSSILKVSLNVANAQCDCDGCFLIHNEEGDKQKSIASEKF